MLDIGWLVSADSIGVLAPAEDGICVRVAASKAPRSNLDIILSFVLPRSVFKSPPACGVKWTY